MQANPGVSIGRPGVLFLWKVVISGGIYRVLCKYWLELKDAEDHLIMIV